MSLYLDGFEEVQVAHEVILSMVQPAGCRLTDYFLYQRRHFLVLDGHKVLQTGLAPLPGTQVLEVDPETSQDHLVGKMEVSKVRVGSGSYYQ